jgi:quercetin dioxygenase-like cupin family protein
MDDSDSVEFDDLIAVALARSVARADLAPRPEVRSRLLAQVAAPPVPEGFAFRFDAEADWVPHPIPGILMKVLAINHTSGYATVLFDVAPGARFPPHHHSGAEECYVISGSLYTCDRRLGPGDFVHADANTDHGELWTDEGCRVLLIVPPEDYFPEPPR